MAGLGNAVRVGAVVADRAFGSVERADAERDNHPFAAGRGRFDDADGPFVLGMWIRIHFFVMSLGLAV